MSILLLSVILGAVSSTFMQENVIFHKLNEITTTRSKWLVSFVIDLAPYDKVIQGLSSDLVLTSHFIQKVIIYYNKNDTQVFRQTFGNLEKQFPSLSHIYDAIYETF